MSAPAALAFAKLFYPETEESQTKADDIKVPKGFTN
jgi:pyrimidine nucleoside transport protein